MQFVGDEKFVNQRIGAVPPVRKTIQIARAAFDAWVGRYEFVPGFQISLTREGERFFGPAAGQPKLEICPSSEEVYFSTAVEAELRFQPVTENVARQ